MTAESLVQSFRPATEADIPSILALRRSVWSDMWWDDEAVVRWRYISRRAADETIPYWLFHKGNELIGACGLEPVTLSIDGTLHDASRTLDIMVRPDYEGRGLGAMMNLLLFRNFPILLVTGSNDASHNLISRMFEHAADLVFWKTIVGSHHLIDPSANRVTRLVATAANALLSVVHSRRLPTAPANVDIRELAQFDDTNDLLHHYERPGRIMVRRSAEYLNWRFLQNPRCRYRAFGAFVGDRLDGYVVTRLNLARHNPRREAEIVDWLAAPAVTDRPSSLPALFAMALGTLKSGGAGLVTCAAHDAGELDAAEANGFVRRTTQRIPFFVRAAAADVQARLASESGWFLTRGDLDVE